MGYHLLGDRSYQEAFEKALAPMTYHNEIDPVLLGSIHDLVSRVACDHLKAWIKPLVGRFRLQGIEKLLLVCLGVFEDDLGLDVLGRLGWTRDGEH